MIKAIFFDLDDTLIDAMECHLKANRLTFESLGVNYEQLRARTKRKYDFLGMRMSYIMKIYRDESGFTESQVPLEKLINDREEHFLAEVENSAILLPGVKQTLESVKHNPQIKVLAVVSSGTEKYIKTAIDKFKLNEYFDFIVSGETVENGKPAPDCYNLAFEKIPKNFQIKKSECLVVEDSANGIKAGHDAEMKTLFVPSKYNKNVVENYDWKIKSLLDFDIESFS